MKLFLTRPVDSPLNLSLPSRSNRQTPSQVSPSSQSVSLLHLPPTNPLLEADFDLLFFFFFSFKQSPPTSPSTTSHPSTEPTANFARPSTTAPRASSVDSGPILPNQSGSLEQGERTDGMSPSRPLLRRREESRRRRREEARVDRRGTR